MDSLLDDVARVLASPVSRREAFARIAKLLSGAVLASVVGAPKAARAQDQEQDKRNRGKCRPPTFACGSGEDDDERQICCPPGTCCNKGEEGSKCCQKGQCMCEDGRCASSTGGRCPEDCRRC
jgi:hypothetical protein